MQTVAFRTVLESILAMVGQAYDSSMTGQLDQVVALLNLRVAEAWAWGKWPEWTVCEERAFADDWDATRTFVEGDLVYYATDGLYYEALKTTLNEIPPDTAAAWVLSTSYRHEIAWEQYAKTKIGRIWHIGNKDLQRYTDWRDYSFTETTNGVTVLDCALATVWTMYGKRAPQFTAKVWTAPGTQYSRYDLVYYPGDEASGIFPNRGEVYQCELDASGNAIYLKIDMPRVLAQFVTLATAADVAQSQGRPELRMELEGRAYQILNDEARKAGIAPAGVRFVAHE